MRANKKLANKTFLKIIIICAVSFCVTAIAVAGLVVIESNETSGLKICVASDIHVLATSLINEDNYTEYSEEDKLENISQAVFETFCDRIAESDYDCLLVCGDLAEYGDETSSLAVAAALKRIKDSGIKVFVINGNHDVKTSVDSTRLSQRRFREIYYDFGYSEAVSECEGTLSYAADIDEEYRLIAIDDIAYYPTEDYYKSTVTDAEKAWIYAQIKECAADGKKPIIIAHKPFLTHFPELTEMFDNEDDEKCFEELVDFFARNGAYYSFVGHEHLNDISSREVVGDNAKYTFYETETGCMQYCNCAYRQVVFGKDSTVIESKYIYGVENKYLSDCVPQEDRLLVTTDLQTYASNRLRSNVSGVIRNLASDGGLADITMPSRIAVLQPVYDILKTEVLQKTIDTPFYIKDEKEGGTSLERILNGYGITLEASKYTDIPSLAAEFVYNIAYGGEDYTATGVELDLVKYSVYEVFWYLGAASSDINAALDGISDDDEDYPDINLDTEKLFKSGVLECYASNFMPCLMAVASNYLTDLISPTYSDTIKYLIQGLLGTDFGNIHNTIVVGLINGLTDSKLVGFDAYFGNTYIDLGKFIVEGMYGNYISDFVKDKEPADIYLKIDVSSIVRAYGTESEK